MPGVLYSTNPLIKLFIQERYRDDVHYVWCSDRPDSRTVSPHSFGSLTPPTSNPMDIYRDLRAAATRGDRHNDKILQTRAGYLALAQQWLSTSEISVEQHEEIAAMLNTASFDLWRPVLYIIPADPVASRMKLVPPARRAGHGPEWIVEDLRRAEFDIVEF